MDKEKNTNLPGNDDWLEELIGAVELRAETGVTEPAAPVRETPLISNEELEQIMREAMSGNFEEEIYTESEITIPEEEFPQGYVEGSDMIFIMDEEEEVPEEIPEEEPEEEPGQPIRKVRPKHKKGYGLLGLPHLLSTAIWLVIAVAIGVSMGRLMWVCAADVLAFGRPNQSITITVTDTDVDAVTDMLYDAGLIRYKALFKLYASVANADKKIAAGTYVLNTQYDYHALVSGMSASSSYREVVTVKIPEGYTCAQIFALLESKGVCTAETLENYASSSEFASYSFLEGVPRGSKYCLEGFLFPDTYEFYTNDTPQRIFDKMLSRFADQVDEDLLAYMDELNGRIDKDLTLYEVVILASIVQKESAHSGENYTIASVFFNRLRHSSSYPFLNSDATVVYAHGGKQDLTAEDYRLDSPYNTYVVKGLPVGPISNPGLSAIMSALRPETTEYHYFVLDPSKGEHLFATNYEEHLKNVASVGGNNG